MSYPIEEIEGIGKKYGKKLSKAGIRTTAASAGSTSSPYRAGAVTRAAYPGLLGRGSQRAYLRLLHLPKRVSQRRCIYCGVQCARGRRSLGGGVPVRSTHLRSLASG